MHLLVSNLKSTRQWRAALGCDEAHFADLLVLFKRAYWSLNQSQLSDRMILTPFGSSMKAESELLLFTLFSCKSGLTYDALGFVCGVDGSTAKRRQEEGLAVLRHALRLANCLPERAFTSPAELQRYFSKRRALLLDATEFATQRPRDEQQQKKQYSGKKNGTRSNRLSSATRSAS